MVGKVCIIGAGPSGITALKELVEVGVDCECFEIQTGTGGLFNRDNYENSVHTSSKIYTSFACFPPADGVRQCGHYTLPDYCEYNERYLREFGVDGMVRYEHKIEHLEQRDDKTWDVTVCDLKTKASFTRNYDVVVVGSGTHTHAPDPKSVSFMKGFAGQVIHSNQFRNSCDFENKKVVVVGGGESASDIACKVAKVASQSYLACRARTGHVTPRGPHMPEDDHLCHYHHHAADPENQCPDESFDLDLSPAHFCTATTQLGGVSSYRDIIGMINGDFYPGMRTNLMTGSHINSQFGTKNAGFSSAVARYGMTPKPPIDRCDGRTVYFEDGTTAEDVDCVVLCIGYAPDFPFLPCDIKMKVMNPRNSLKHCIHPDFDNFFIIGWVRPAFGNIPTISEMQSRWVAKLLTGRVQYPFGGDKDKMRAQIEADRASEEAQYASAKRIKSLASYYVSVNDIATYAELHPNYLAIALKDPLLGAKILLGQFNCYIFRLNEDYDKYRDIIMQIPTTHFVPFDLSAFLTLCHLWLILGNVIRFPDCVPQDRVAMIPRLGLAALLFLNPYYRYVVAYPAAAVTLLIYLCLKLNSIVLEGNFRRYVLRKPMPAYDCLKPTAWDDFHKKYAFFQFAFVNLVTLPMDLCSIWAKAFLENRPDPWNAPKHIKQAFKYRDKMHAMLTGKANEKWSIWA